MQQKSCPRCGVIFICRHDEPVRCQCAGIQLTSTARAWIRANYTDCLCANCLKEINKMDL